MSISTNSENPTNSAILEDTSIATTIARYKKIVADLELIQQTNPDAHVNSFIIYENGQIVPMLFRNDSVITTNESTDAYNNKTTYTDLKGVPYELGSLVFIPIKKEEDYQITYKDETL